MTTKEIYESIDQSKISPKGKDFLQKAEKSTKGFTIENEKLETVMRKIYKDLKERKPEALKNVKVKTVEVTEKVPTTKTERKKEPKKTTKTVKKRVKKASGTKKNTKPTKTPSTPKEGKKEHISTRASKLAKKEGITFKEARAKISKLVKEESKKAEKQTEKELDKLLAFVRKESFEGEEKYPKTYGKQKPDSANLSQDAKRRAKPVGKRVSKNGKTYYEYRDNRSDRNSLPAPKGEYRYKGKTPPFLEAGGTLPTPFGQAGLVGETGTMNEMDLFAMGGGLPQGVHQYYANTYNPAYPTPHGYAKGGKIDTSKKGVYLMELKDGTFRVSNNLGDRDFPYEFNDVFPTKERAMKFANRVAKNSKSKVVEIKYAKGGMVEYAILEDYYGNDIKKMKFAKPIMESEVVEPTGYSLADIDEDEDGVLYARFQQEDEFAKGGEIDGRYKVLLEKRDNSGKLYPPNLYWKGNDKNLIAEKVKEAKKDFPARKVFVTDEVGDREIYNFAKGGEIDAFIMSYVKGVPEENTNLRVDTQNLTAKLKKGGKLGYAKGGVMKTYDDFGKDYDAFTDYVMDRISLEERRKIRKQWNQSKSKMQWQDYLLKEVNKKSMAKGGELSKEFKFDKNFVIYVPSTSNVGDTISKSELDKRVDEVEIFVANKFGGYTETETDGGYKSTSGKIIEEDIVKVSVFAKANDWKKNEKSVISKVRQWAKKWGQEAIGFEYEGDLYYVSESKIMEAGGTLPTPFGQAGLVGETGAMNEMDLFAMGGGLPQGVHQYYANTYNPAYPTPHGYANGGELEDEMQYGYWYVKINEDENDEEIRNQEVARLIREGYTSGYEPRWYLEITDIDGDIDEATEQHIAKMVEDGYTSGEVVMYKDNYAKGGYIVEDGKVMLNGNKIGSYQFDRDSNSFWIYDGVKDRNFEEKEDIIDYFENRNFAKGGTVQGHLDKADGHLREVGTKLYTNKNPKEAKFRKAYNQFDERVDDLFTRRELSELGYAKGGYIIYKDKGYLAVDIHKKSGDYVFLTKPTTKKLATAMSNIMKRKKGSNQYARKVITFKEAKKQGYNDKLDESLGNTKGKRSTKEQNYKDRRNESEAMEKKSGKRKYARVKTMDNGTRKKRKTPMTLAKAIRRDGEKWQDAVKRATMMMKKEK